MTSDWPVVQELARHSASLVRKGRREGGEEKEVQSGGAGFDRKDDRERAFLRQREVLAKAQNARPVCVVCGRREAESGVLSFSLSLSPSLLSPEGRTSQRGEVCLVGEVGATQRRTLWLRRARLCTLFRGLSPACSRVSVLSSNDVMEKVRSRGLSGSGR